jgi:zinc transporter ZupT
MLATGLGALPVLFTRRLSPLLLGAGYSLAGGMMLSVSFFDLVAAGSRAGQPLGARRRLPGPPAGLGFAAMSYLVLAELIPETLQQAGKHATAGG